MTPTQEAAMRHALEALYQAREHVTVHTDGPWQRVESDCHAAITALRAALAEEAMQRLTDVQQEMESEIKVDKAEPVQEPVAWMLIEHEKYGNAVVVRKHKPKTYDSNWWTLTPLYTAPPPPQRKPLTEEEIVDIYIKRDATPGVSMADFARAIERAHGIGDEK